MSKYNGTKSVRSGHNGRLPKYADVWAQSNRSDINWSQEGMNRYFNDISRYPLLTAAEEFSCACDIERAYLNVFMSLLRFSSAQALFGQWHDQITAGTMFVSDYFIVHPEENGRRFQPKQTLEMMQRWRSLFVAMPVILTELSEERIATLVLGKKNSQLSARNRWAASSVTKLRLTDERLLQWLIIARQELAVRVENQPTDITSPMAASLDRAERYVARLAQLKEQMIKANVRLVVKIAKNYYGKTPLSFSDVLGEGQFGLIEAVNRFNCHRGARFATYAIWWIRQSIVHGTTNTGHFIRRPQHVQTHVNRLIRLVSSANVMKLKPEEVANMLGIDRVTAETVVRLLSVPVESLDELRYKDGGDTIIETIADPLAPRTDERALQHLKRQELERALAKLTCREAQIIRLRFGLDGAGPLTLEQIGRKLGVTRERIRQIESQAIKKMKRYIRLMRGESLTR